MPPEPRKEQEHEAGEQGSTWPASYVRTHWRDIVSDANINGHLIVTHHNRAEVVVVSLARYEHLTRTASANEALATLRAEFDREIAVLRQPGAAEKLRQLSSVTPEEIAEAANSAVSERNQ
jgi:PHD/YefM family antitoxin component YafN of YafNO toxin-antitoxin module